MRLRPAVLVVAALLVAFASAAEKKPTSQEREDRGDDRSWFARTFGAIGREWGLSATLNGVARTVGQALHVGKFRNHGSEVYAEKCVITQAAPPGCPFADWLAFKHLQATASRKKGMMFALRSAVGMHSIQKKMGMLPHYDVTKWDRQLKNQFVFDWKREMGERNWVDKADLNGPSMEHNDHNFNSMLGQGNTLGFVAGNLRIDTKSLPDKYKKGMFAENAVFPAVARFSDFGQDGGPVQLARMALKVNVPSAVVKGANPDGEVNLLTTESMKNFPMDGFQSLNQFTKMDRTNKLMSTLSVVFNPKDAINMLWNVVKTGGKAGEAIKKDADSRILSKEYHSQVPYAVGMNTGPQEGVDPGEWNGGANPVGAMKFSFVPERRRHYARETMDNYEHCRGDLAKRLVGKARTWFCKRNKFRESIRNTLLPAEGKEGEGGQRFTMKLTIVPFSPANDKNAAYNRFMRDATADWSKDATVKEYDVGTLHIPPQEMDDSLIGFSKPLKIALDEAHGENTKLDSSVFHKAYYFHPGLTHPDHQPLGEINAYRMHFYPIHAKARVETMQQQTANGRNDNTLFETNVGNDPEWESKKKEPLWFPFAALKKQRGCNGHSSRLPLFGDVNVCTAAEEAPLLMR